MVNGTFLKIGATASVTLALSAMGFMGNGIVENDRRNTGQHIEIRKEMIVADASVREKVDAVKDIVTDIRLEQRTMVEVLKRIESK